MASPQLENGYIRIANELYQAMYKIDLSASELRILHFIVYQTYGYNKKERVLSVGYIANGVELPDVSVKRSLKKLIEKNIVLAESNFKNSPKTLSINKKYKEWCGIKNDTKVVSKMTYQNRYHNGIKNDTTMVSKLTHKTIQKNNTEKQDRVVGNHPTIDEVFSYCESKGYSFDVEKFFSTYEATGWKSRGSDIVKWQALADVWQKTEKAKPQDQKLDCWGKPIKKEITGRQ